MNEFVLPHSTECFCGNVIPEGSIKLSDPQCNYKCSGDGKQLCGGYFTISIFETGIKSILMNEPPASHRISLTTFIFISEFTPQVANLMPNPATPKARIVFLLTLNGRAVRQVYRLLKLIYGEQHFYYIHVDSVSPYLCGNLH